MKFQTDRQYLVDMAGNVWNSYKEFIERALNRDNYEISNIENETGN